MKFLLSLCLLASLTIVNSSSTLEIPQNRPSVYQFNVQDIAGNRVHLSKYEGKIILIVNVASKCGFTPQYRDLQKFYDTYSDQDLVVLAFPSNSFRQEPKSEDEIRRFCTQKYGITFPMFSKVIVKGKDIHPLYKFLTRKESNQSIDAPVRWNFQKFLINHRGEVVQSFPSQIKVTGKSFDKVFKRLLAERDKELNP